MVRLLEDERVWIGLPYRLVGACALGAGGRRSPYGGFWLMEPAPIHRGANLS